MLSTFLQTLRRGDEVYWNDPDESLCSGIYKVHAIMTDSDLIVSENTVVVLKNGDSIVEAFARELC